MSSRWPERDNKHRKGPGTGIDKLSDLLDPALKKMGVRSQVREAQIRQVFAEVVGPAISTMCQAVRLDGGTLVIATSSPALAHQLQADQPRLLASLNERLGKAGTVRRLRFTA